MTFAVGIGLAFIAMLTWGFGDFLIQRSTRKIGNLETLFIITAFGAIVFFPFVVSDLPAVMSSGSSDIWIITLACVFIFLAALVDFEALRRGKLAIVEPLLSLEVPVAALLAFFLVGERLTLFQMILILALLFFLMQVSWKQKKLSKSIFLEKGVIFALAGAMLMGLANFFMGWGGRVSDPLMIMFLTNTFIAVCCAALIISNSRFGHLMKDVRSYSLVWLPMSISDNVAWLAYVSAMSLAPIAVVTALSESYIIITVILGLAVNREKLQRHQKIGLVGAILVALLLAWITIK